MIRSVFQLVPVTLAFAMMASLAARTPSSLWPRSLKTRRRIVAIDVLLEPSADMAQFAEAANKGVRKDYPAGFTLGAQHVPHISLVHRYVRAGDLPQLEAKLAAVLAANNPLIIQLTATGYEHSQWDGLALMTIGIERSAALSRVQAKVAEAIEPFSVPDGSADAFAVNTELPKIDETTVDYVKNFIPNASEKNYRPHITVGLARNYVKDIEAIGFPRRTFRPAGVAIYQLGDFGTAQKKLWSWDSRESNP